MQKRFLLIGLSFLIILSVRTQKADSLLAVLTEANMQEVFSLARDMDFKEAATVYLGIKALTESLDTTSILEIRSAVYAAEAFRISRQFAEATKYNDLVLELYESGRFPDANAEVSLAYYNRALMSYLPKKREENFDLARSFGKKDPNGAFFSAFYSELLGLFREKKLDRAKQIITEGRLVYDQLSNRWKGIYLDLYYSQMVRYYSLTEQWETARVLLNEAEARIKTSANVHPDAIKIMLITKVEFHTLKREDDLAVATYLTLDTLSRVAPPDGIPKFYHVIYPAILATLYEVGEIEKGRLIYAEVAENMQSLSDQGKEKELYIDFLTAGCLLNTDDKTQCYDCLKNIQKDFSFNSMSIIQQLLWNTRDRQDYRQLLQETQSALIFNHQDFSSDRYLDNPTTIERTNKKLFTFLFMAYKAKAATELFRQTDSLRYLAIADSTLARAFELLPNEFSASKSFLGAKTSMPIEIAYLSRVYGDLMLAKHDARLKAPINEYLSRMEVLRSRSLLRSLEPIPIDKTVLAPLEALESEIENLLSQPKTAEQKIDSRLLDLYRQREAAQQALKDQYGQQYRYFYDNSIQKGLDVIGDLPPSTGILYFNPAFNNQELVIGLLTKDKRTFRRSVNTESIERQLEEYLGLLNHPLITQKKRKIRFLELSHRIYQMIFAPIESEISELERLIIIPDSRFYALPFESLLSQAADPTLNFNELPFLIKDLEINYQYSLSTFAALQKAKSTNNGAVLGFAPVFDQEKQQLINSSRAFAMDTFTRTLVDGIVQPLPYTEQEVKGISVAWPAAQLTLLLREQATITNLRQALDKPYQIIHFATHGLVNTENAFSSALACYADNPKDQFLTASNIQRLKIDADLLLLSSCDSGIGQAIKMEGMLSLGQAFIYAGAKNVIFSLWKVSDKYSSSLMLKFYEQLAQGYSYTQALRNAKLELLNNPQSMLPRYWAPFVLIGQ